MAKKWNARDATDAQAKAANEASARALEQSYQRSIDKAVQDGQRTIDQLTADAITARASADSLRGAADKLAARLAASQAGGNSCTTAASAAASRAVLVLADVFKRADQRADDLAEVAVTLTVLVDLAEVTVTLASGDSAILAVLTFFADLDEVAVTLASVCLADLEDLFDFVGVLFGEGGARSTLSTSLCLR